MNNSDDTQMDEEQIVEGEITETEDSTTQLATADTNQATVLLNLENLIKSHVGTIEKLKIDAKAQKEMLDDIFLNEPTFKEHEALAKEANKVKSQTRAQIMKRPNVQQLVEKIKSMQADVKDIQSALSDYLQEYQRLSGQSSIEDDDGEVRNIVYTARLVKKSKYRP
jgi:hypothetical protein